MNNLREKLVKIGAQFARRAGYAVFEMVRFAVSEEYCRERSRSLSFVILEQRTGLENAR